MKVRLFMGTCSLMIFSFSKSAALLRRSASRWSLRSQNIQPQVSAAGWQTRKSLKSQSRILNKDLI